jgi:heme-degrading monooxygenase HmoA
MRKFGEAQKKHDGLIVTLAVKDPDAGMLIGISVWKSKADFDAAWRKLSVTEVKRREEEAFRFEDYETDPHKVYSGEEPA